MKRLLTNRDYLYAVLVLLCVHAGPYLLLSVITTYGRLLSGSDTLAGSMASVFALSGLVARFLSAWLLGRIGMRRTLLAFEGAMAAASLAYVFCSSFAQAFALRAVQGLAYGVSCTAMSTYIVRTLDPADRLEGIGYSSLTANLAGAVCPVVAFSLIGDTAVSFQPLFVAVLATTVVSLALMAFLRDRGTDEPKASEAKATRNNGAGSTLPVAALAVPFSLWLLLSLSMSSINSCLPLLAADRGLGSVGAFFTISVVGLLLARVAASRIVGAVGERAALVAGILVMAACMLGISAAGSLVVLYAIALPFGFAQGLLAPLVNTRLVNTLPDERAGLANALFFAAGDAGFIVGPTAQGALAAATSYGTVFVACAAVAAAAAALALVFYRQQRQAA